METGAITGYIDVAQVVLYGFWIFFAGLVIYLRREDKREGYPLESDRSEHVKVQGFPGIPEPKSFELRDGRIVYAPRVENPEGIISAKPSAVSASAGAKVRQRKPAGLPSSIRASGMVPMMSTGKAAPASAMASTSNR